MVLRSAGTGKTIVAIHRVAHLTKESPTASLLLTTFSEALAAQLQIKLHRLIPADSDSAIRITVRSLNEVGMSNTKYQKMTGIGNRTALRDLDVLQEQGLMVKTGKLKSTRYHLNIPHLSKNL